MIRNTYQRLGVATVACLLVVAIVAPGVVAAATATSVSLTPETETVESGETTTFDMVVDTADGGVGAYTATVSVDDPSVGTITDVSLEGTPGLSDIDYAEDNSSVTINAALMNTADTGSVTIATVTVLGGGEGETDVSLDVSALGDEEGNSYDVTGTSDATLSVTSPEEPSDPNEVTVTQTPESVTVAPGDTVEFEATVNATGLNAPGLDVDLPSGWTIESQSAEGDATYKSLEYQWVWLSGGEYTVTYTVAVPSDATDDTYSVVAEGSAIDPATDERLTDTVTSNVTVEEPNQAPTADAGDDQTVEEGETVILDATDSSDPDGDELSYQWTQTAGPDVTLDDETSPTPSFTAPEVGDDETLTFELEVSDDELTDTDSVDVTVQDTEEEETNQAPIADAGDDQTVEEDDEVTLDATDSSDPDGDELSYQWTQTDGPDVTLDDDTSATPSFTAPEIDADETLTFQLQVFDGNGAMDTDSVDVTVQDVPENSEPIADAGEDQTVEEGETVTLDATGSSDPDGDTLSYQWTQTAGQSVTLEEADTATPSFTAPAVDDDETLTFELEVSDGELTNTDSVNVTVQDSDGEGDGDEGATSDSTVTVESATVTSGETAELDVTLSDAPDGLSEYTLRITVGKGNAAELVDISFPDGMESTSEPTYSNGGQTVQLTAADVDGTVDSGASDVALATAHLEATKPGKVQVSVEVVQMDDNNDGSIDPTTEAGTLSVRPDAKGGNQPPMPSLISGQPLALFATGLMGITGLFMYIWPF